MTETAVANHMVFMPIGSIQQDDNTFDLDSALSFDL